jgi:hypothetical protein
MMCYRSKALYSTKNWSNFVSSSNVGSITRGWEWRLVSGQYIAAVYVQGVNLPVRINDLILRQAVQMCKGNCNPEVHSTTSSRPVELCACTDVQSILQHSTSLHYFLKARRALCMYRRAINTATLNFTALLPEGPRAVFMLDVSTGWRGLVSFNILQLQSKNYPYSFHIRLDNSQTRLAVMSQLWIEPSPPDHSQSYWLSYPWS